MRKLAIIPALLLLLGLGACGGAKTTRFVHPEFDFGYLEKVAVVPFENLADDQGAGAQATRYFLTTLLAAEAFSVVEPGETARALQVQGLVRTAQMNQAQIQAVGRDLGVQGLFMGTVSESTTMRTGTTTVNVVTVVVRLVETETGATVWSATRSENSSTFWSSLFGTSQKSRAVVMRSVIDSCMDTLLD